MENIVEISRTLVLMAFVATCIEATTRLLRTSYKEVYERMKSVGLIEQYIVPHYETLHSESRENIARNIAECLKISISPTTRFASSVRRSPIDTLHSME